jgi:hypothetical protein
MVIVLEKCVQEEQLQPSRVRIVKRQVMAPDNEAQELQGPRTSRDRLGEVVHKAEHMFPVVLVQVTDRASTVNYERVVIPQQTQCGTQLNVGVTWNADRSENSWKRGWWESAHNERTCE